MKQDEPAPTREVPTPSGLPAPTRELRAAPPLAPTRELPTRQPLPPPPPRRRELDNSIPLDPISKLLQVAREVAEEALTILKHPRDFPRRLQLDDHTMFMHGTRFLLGTVPALYLLLIPVHIIHGRPATQTAVGIMFTATAFFVGSLVHGLLKVFGARTTPMRTTIGLYAYVVGFQSVLFIVLTYPVALRLGSKIFFGGASQQEVNAMVAALNLTDQIFVMLFILVAYVVSAVFLFWGFIPLFRQYYALGRFGWIRAALSTMIPFMIASIIVQLFMPVIRKAADSL